MTNKDKVLKRQLIIDYEIRYDPKNDWHALDEETNDIDHSQGVTTSEEIAKCLLDSLIKYDESLALGKIEDNPLFSEELGSYEESVVNEVKEHLGLDQEGDLPDEYSSLVRSVSIKTSLSELRIEDYATS